MSKGVISISVTAPARLHLGFLDLNGSRGRRYGSVGLALDAPCVELSIRHAPAFASAGPQAQRAAEIARKFCERYALTREFQLNISQAIPEHAGLGSGTQLGLAVGVACARMHGLALTIREIAAVAERGQRSGIGAGAFESGGFLVDGGKGEGDDPPPVISRLEFPEEWRILLVFERAARGLHGDRENAAFRELPPFPAALSGHLCRLMVMQALPALAERNIERFGEAIGELQRVTGDHFQSAQGGRFASPQVAEVLAWLESQGIAGIGQSSWGPTGFAIIASEDQAEFLADKARARWGEAGRLQFETCRGRNRGGSIEATQTMVAPLKAGRAS